MHVRARDTICSGALERTDIYVPVLCKICIIIFDLVFLICFVRKTVR